MRENLRHSFRVEDSCFNQVVRLDVENLAAANDSYPTFLIFNLDDGEDFAARGNVSVALENVVYGLVVDFDLVAAVEHF
jgi:hypothetical protein